MLKNAIGAGLLAAAAHSAALTLGAPQGGAIVGRPLDLLLRFGADPGEAVAGLCLEAELRYGETRLPASAVSVTVGKLADDGSGTLRVRSSVAVDEPVVTLLLSAGCSQRLSRHYLLLADVEAARAAPRSEASPSSGRELPLRQASAASRLPPLQPGDGPRRPRRDHPSDAAESPIRLPPPQARPAGVLRAIAKSRPETARAAGDAPRPVDAAQAPASPRLRLDLVELSAARGLIGKQVPATAGAVEAAVDGQGVAAGGPGGGEAAAEGRRIGEMARELEGLRAEQARMRAALESVNSQLDRERARRLPDPLVLGLLGACAAALAALAWWSARWRRQRARLSGAGAARPD